MAAYRIEFKKSARKEFDRLPRKVQEKVVEALKFLSESPFSDLLNIKKIKGEESLYRIRIGDYRLVYEVQTAVLFVIVIKGISKNYVRDEKSQSRPSQGR